MKTFFLATILLLLAIGVKAQPPMPVNNVTQCFVTITRHCYDPACNPEPTPYPPGTPPRTVNIPPGGGWSFPGGCTNPPYLYPVYEVCWTSAMAPGCPSNNGICVMVDGVPPVPNPFCAAGTFTAQMPNHCPACTPTMGDYGADVTFDPATGGLEIRGK